MALIDYMAYVFTTLINTTFGLSMPHDLLNVHMLGAFLKQQWHNGYTYTLFIKNFCLSAADLKLTTWLNIFKNIMGTKQ